MVVSVPAQAQSFLNKLKEKAEQAVGSVSEKLGDAVGGILPEGMKDSAGVSDTDGGFGVVSGEQALPPRRASTFGWDGPVTPSSASFPVPLMNEFPAVPSASDLVNPVEEKQIAYYQAIKAVTIRAEELNMDQTCEDEETLMWRKKSNQILKDSFGLTDAEIAMLERDDLSEAEQQRLEEKISKAILGDLDVDALEKQAAQYEGKSEDELVDEMMDNSLRSTFAVYDRNASDIRKYMGVSTDGQFNFCLFETEKQRVTVKLSKIESDRKSVV